MKGEEKMFFAVGIHEDVECQSGDLLAEGVHRWVVVPEDSDMVWRGPRMSLDYCPFLKRTREHTKKMYGGFNEKNPNLGFSIKK